MHRLPALLLVAILTLPAEEDPLRDLLDRVRLFESQIALVERESVGLVDREALWAGACRGMIETSDRNASYLSREDLAVHGLGSELQRFGFGFSWRREGGSLQVSRVVPASPAAAAGLHPGAILLGIDAVDLETAKPNEAVLALAHSGDTAQLRWRDLEGVARSGRLARADIADDGLCGLAMPAPGIAHLRIGAFLPATSDQSTATATAAAVRRQLGRIPELRAVIIDLRGNGGGNLQAAVEIAAGWLPPGVAVIEQAGRNPARSRVWSAEVPRLPDVPAVVLVDAQTASAAEVLAHALRRGRGSPLIGTRTHGKWSVQQLFLLPRGDACMLTVAQLASPGGGRLDQPLDPDTAIPQDSAVTWRRLQAELAGTSPLPPDPQLERAVDIAHTLTLRPQR